MFFREINTNFKNMYSGTSLILTPLGPKIIFLISEVYFFRGRIVCIKVGTQSSVLIKQGVLIS